jgi:hypothetical protein
MWSPSFWSTVVPFFEESATLTVSQFDAECQARWLRTVCEAPVVFITGYTDRATVERIHEQVPDAPVLAKVGYHNRLADAVAAVTPPLH